MLPGCEVDRAIVGDRSCDLSMEHAIAADGCERLIAYAWSMVTDERQRGRGNDRSHDNHRRTCNDEPVSASTGHFPRLVGELRDPLRQPHELRVVAKHLDHLSR